MSRRAPTDPNVQPELPISNDGFDPHSRDGMRVAYELAGYERLGISIDEALEDTGLSIALRLYAEAIARSLNKPH